MEITQGPSHRFLFGPVPSRRLGRSLGVDTIPFKTCSYDCVYCQLGKTTHRTCKRQSFFPLDEILQELVRSLPEIPRPDYITLSGSGEPTLQENIGDIIRGIKRITDIPVAVLTNGSLFWIEEVRRAVLEADLIIPSLDAGDEEVFRSINRPHPEITFEKMVQGLYDLRLEFEAPIWLEVFLVNNMNTREDQLEKIKGIIDQMKPDRIQLNTAVRGAAEDFVEAVSAPEMKKIQQFFGEQSEIIAHDVTGSEDQPGHDIALEDILNFIKRRPCSIDDLANGLKIHRNEVIKYIYLLNEDKRITAKKWNNTILYVAQDTPK